MPSSNSSRIQKPVIFFSGFALGTIFASLFILQLTPGYLTSPSQSATNPNVDGLQGFSTAPPAPSSLGRHSSNTEHCPPCAECKPQQPCFCPHCHPCAPCLQTSPLTPAVPIAKALTARTKTHANMHDMAVIIPHLKGSSRQMHPEWWEGMNPRYYQIFDDHIEAPEGDSFARMDRPTFPERDKTIQWAQGMDFISILDHWASENCEGHPYFMFAEDDNKPCPSYQYHTSMLRTWIHNNMHAFTYIRVSSGFSGLIFRCDLLPNLVNHLRQLSDRFKKGKDRFPIDWALRDWKPSNPNGERPNPPHYYIYKMNLLEHASSSSTIWKNDQELADRNELVAHCYENLHWPALTDEESFWNERCEDYLLAPCDENSQYPVLKVPFSDGYANHFIDQEKASQIGTLKVIVGQHGESCTQACSKSGLRCERSFIQLLNRRDIMTGLHPQCAERGGEGPDGVRWRFSLGSEVPMFRTNGMCHVQKWLRIWSCDASWSEAARVCPCV